MQDGNSPSQIPNIGKLADQLSSQNKAKARLTKLNKALSSKALKLGSENGVTAEFII